MTIVGGHNYGHLGTPSHDAWGAMPDPTFVTLLALAAPLLGIVVALAWIVGRRIACA